MYPAKFIFGRKRETQLLRERLGKRKSFLLHGYAGVGKTLLVQEVAKTVLGTLYCGQSESMQKIIHNLAHALLAAGDEQAAAQFGRNPGDKIKSLSMGSLKGMVVGILCQKSYSIVLDHVRRSSQVLARAMKEMSQRTKTPITVVARSAHMEDAGFFLKMFSDKSERVQLLNFDPATATQFVIELGARVALNPANLDEFVSQVVQLTAGNPGAIQSLVELARLPKYWSGDRIKITSLYLDHLMNWKP